MGTRVSIPNANDTLRIEEEKGVDEGLVFPDEYMTG
jgi:hypothetical protein